MSDPDFHGYFRRIYPIPEKDEFTVTSATAYTSPIGIRQDVIGRQRFIYVRDTRLGKCRRLQSKTAVTWPFIGSKDGEILLASLGTI
jgi:hypothetical protein